MTRLTTQLTLDELTANFAAVFHRVVDEGETIVVKDVGERMAVLKPLKRRKLRRNRERSDSDYAAALTAAGSWHDVDTDAFINDVYADRSAPPRPKVEV